MPVILSGVIFLFSAAGIAASVLLLKEKKIDVSRLSREDKDYIQSLGETENSESETLCDQPLESPSRCRCTSPFTIESLYSDATSKSA